MIRFLAVGVGRGFFLLTYPLFILQEIVLYADNVRSVILCRIFQGLTHRCQILIPGIAHMIGLLTIQRIVFPGLLNRISPGTIPPDLLLIIGLFTRRTVKLPALIGLANPIFLGCRPFVLNGQCDILAVKCIFFLLYSSWNAVFAGIVLNKRLMSCLIESSDLTEGHRPIAIVPSVLFTQCGATYSIKFPNFLQCTFPF